MLSRLKTALRALLRRQQFEREMDEELRYHIEQQTEQNIRLGMSPEEARYAALKSFGGVEQAKERSRDARGVRWLEGLWQDLRFGARMLVKNPGFTMIAVITLSLGIGANTAIFTLFNAVVLRPLQVREPDNIVNLWSGYSQFSYPQYVAYRDHNEVLSGLVASAPVRLTLDEGTDGNNSSASGLPGRIRGSLVSGNYFSVLGANVAAGRTFLPEEDQVPGAHPVAVLSFDFWQRHFGADPNVVGKMLRLNNVRFTLLGVTARDFGGTSVEVPSIWIPLTMQAAVTGSDRLSAEGSWWLDIVGRLKPGVTLAQAQAAMTMIANQLRQTRLDVYKNETVRLTPSSLLREDVRRKVIAGAAIVMAAVGMVLLIACVNIAGLLLARAAARQKEIGVRLALGASRGRIVRQLLTESVLVGLLGGAFGLLVSVWLAGLLARISPPGEQPPGINLTLDVRVFGYALIVSLASGVIFGLAPALRSSRPDLLSTLKDGSVALGQRLSHSRLRSMLVGAQVAVCLMLLIGSGLLIRGWHRSQSTDTGLQTMNVLVAELPLGQYGYDQSRAVEFHRNIKERLATLPGVRAVSSAMNAPLGRTKSSAGITVDGRELPSDGQSSLVNYNVVSGRFFETLGVPLARGRDFSDLEHAAGAPVAIVNEALARRFWPGTEALGKRVRLGAMASEIVGVVRDTQSIRLGEAAEPHLYLPLLAPRGERTPALSSQTNYLDLKLLVRVEGNPKSFAPGMLGSLRALDPNVRAPISTLEENRERWVSTARLGALLSSTLGSVALLLTLIGIYGVVAFVASQRTREIGVRMALGAQRRDVLALVLRQGLKPVVVGAGFGLMGSLAVARMLSQALFGLSPFDPVTFLCAPFFLMMVALLACYLPARRAARVDPMVALRHE